MISPDPHWTSYVGMATGIVGAITGISGGIMGYIGYRKASSMKSLDLRIELRRNHEDVRLALIQLVELREKAERSRKNMAAATGLYKSGGMKKWQDRYEEDEGHVQELRDRLPITGTTFDTLSVNDLEEQIIEIHRIQGLVEDLRQYYRDSLDKDAESGRQLREDQRAARQHNAPKNHPG